jgi:hypothetical protein
MRDGVARLLKLPREIPEHELSRRIARVALQLRLEFLSSLVRRSWRRGHGENDSPETIVNAWQVGILIQDFLVLGHRVVPLAVRFVRFRIEFLRLIRPRRFVGKFLRSAVGKLRAIVGSQVQDLRVVREIPIQAREILESGIYLVQAHRALRDGELGFIFKSKVPLGYSGNQPPERRG